MRLFVGLPIPGDISDQLSTLCNGLPGARWVGPSNMHITLRFVGEVSESDAEEIDANLTKVRVEPFDLELQGFNTFGRGSKTRALWTGIATSPPLDHLHNKIQSAVVRSGQPPESRKFIPHLTVARFSNVDIARLELFIAGNNLFRAGPFPVASFALFESVLGKAGPVYSPLATYSMT